MQFTFDIDIQAIVNKTMAPENIQPVLEQAMFKAFKSAVDSATGYNSDFSKQLVEQLKTALPHGLAIDEVAKFQFVMNKAVNEAVFGSNSDAIRVALSSAIQSVMPDVPQRIKLSELLEKARDGLHKESYESFYAHYEASQYGGGNLALDDDSNCRSPYSANFRLAFNDAGEVYTLRMDGKDITPMGVPQAISRFDGLLLALYVGRSTIEVDIDEHDVSNAASGEED
jgi:hypothetical protein